MTSVIWVSEPSLRIVHKRLAGLKGATKPPTVSSVPELIEAASSDKTISFIDKNAIAALAPTAHVSLPAGPIIAVCDEPIQTAIGWLQPYPWISHVISTSMFEHPYAEELLDNVMRTMLSSGQPRLLDWLGPTVAGRRIRLTHASRRAARLERMTEFFEVNNVGPRTLQLLRDAAEELLTNAFYDAPVAAGAMAKPVSRTEDVALPDDSACDLAYGCREDLAIVRVRDPFGSLSRRRLVEVLTRCAKSDMQVQVDESMGGAGLGMWRIFSGASFVAISVIKGRHTEILVGITKRATSGPRPFAFNMFFKDSSKRRFWKLSDEESNKPSINKSVMIVQKSR